MASQKVDKPMRDAKENITIDNKILGALSLRGGWSIRKRFLFSESLLSGLAYPLSSIMPTAKHATSTVLVRAIDKLNTSPLQVVVPLLIEKAPGLCCRILQLMQSQ